MELHTILKRSLEEFVSRLTISFLTVAHIVPFLLLKDLPRYDCLQEASQRFPDLDPSACQAFLQLLRAGDELSSAQHAYLARHNISQGRFTVLMLLLRASTGGRCAESLNPCNPAELAERAGVTRATMTGLIDTLEKDGYVKREPDPSDRRMMSVTLTPKAEAFLQTMLPGYFRQITALMSGLSEAERQTLVHLLDKVVKQAAGVVGDSSCLASS
jgi:DNA-binding MarR family transcriptional regulator